MKNYAIVLFYCNNKPKENKLAYCLLRVKNIRMSRNDHIYFNISDVLVNETLGYDFELIFKEDKIKKMFNFKQIYYSPDLYYRMKVYSERVLIHEFPNNESALLWFKLNY